MAEREFDVAVEAMLAAPDHAPLPALLSPIIDWCLDRHLAILAADGFDDVRRAHNAVFVHLPAEGRRLTELAAAAQITKQAMGELVDDLVAKGYLRRESDPTDGRAKLILWAERGERAHDATMRAFAAIEAELSDAIGREALSSLTKQLSKIVEALRTLP